ncbi:protein-disulfide reductase DsbD domain-containing protein [Magnetospirillum sp. 64-120]|uniref:protein-disulfide reductase DsbD family protein n=1 Tax=Magnetospirillum sp. 64-120 TaxID=1895778 RepID=UPI00092A15CD|nr:protein-disulfide reductase DsbD domain-containing protein [Magnetospirillum sp. 64-120]OJX73865.1 MAG: disulfide bond formation protein DsbD [Magnetospirillum sp. 64-120]
MKRLLLALLGLLLVSIQARAAENAASSWVENEAGKVRLVAATTATGKAASIHLGLHFQLLPGWKIYWRTPGDAGYPPKIDWTGSKNFGQATVFWPAPKRFVLAGLQNHGYAGEVVLPVDAALPQPHKAVTVKAGLDYLACSQICVPMQASLSLTLPAGPAQPSEFAHLISRYAALVPGPGDRHGLGVDTVEAVGLGDESVLRVTLSAQQPFDHPDLFVEPAETANFDAPKLRLSADRTQAVLEAKVVPGTLTRALLDAPLTITVVDGDRSLESAVTPVAGTAAAPVLDDGGSPVWAMLGIALLGGLILNLMPCVLPVLSIKVLGALGHGGAELRHIRAAFLASAFGIVTSFLALAVLAIAVKSAGAAVGWGIQFQQPWFLAAMIALLLGFALNLWGAFEIRLPSALMNVGGGVAHHTLLGHFLSGAFATLLATPCSAPFLGTAVGFALARGPGEIGAIFAALGLGMAGPYLLVAAWPKAAQALPKPGAWMVRVRQVMGLALAGTALWLGMILGTQLGLLGDADGAPAKGAVAWQVFDQKSLEDQVAAGKVVLVDVTADWCITCKVNKAAVIDRDPVAGLLKGGAVVPMRADWTNPDDTIARYLASFGRYGIPFNAVYGPKAPKGIALPELLSTDDILAAIRQAGG